MITWWRHQMETFSALLAICAGNSPAPVNSPHKGQWRGALMFTLICARINGWVNSREAGDLRCHRAHYDVIVMNVCTCRLSHISQIKLQWRHNEHGWVSNHRRIDYLLNRWFRQRSKKISKLRVTGLCEGNSPVTGEFPTQGASNAENVSIWWHHPKKTVSYPFHLTRIVELTDPWDMRL